MTNLAVSPGVDGMTWEAYERDLDRRIEDLHAQVKSGTYRALPSRRSYIPKEDGSKRPLAVATPPANCTAIQSTFGIG